MKRVSAVLLMVGVFAAGVVAGTLGSHLLHRRHLSDMRRMHHAMEERLQGVGPMLEERLGLSHEQMYRVHGVLQRHFDRMRDLRDRMEPDIRDTLDETQAELEEILTDEQLRRFRRQHFPFLSHGPDRFREHRRHGGRHFGRGHPPDRSLSGPEEAGDPTAPTGGAQDEP